MRFPLWLGLLLGAFSGLLGAADLPLKVERFDGSNASVTTSTTGVEIRGPGSLRLTPASSPGAGSWVLELEYFCLGGADPVKVTGGPPFEAKAARPVAGFTHSETWTRYAVPLAGLAPGWKALRFDVRLKADGVLQLRNVHLRTERPGEFAPQAAAGTNAASAADLEAYLGGKFPGAITRVVVGVSDITITGRLTGPKADVFLGDVPMERLVSDPKPFASLTPVTPDSQGGFTVRLPRRAPQDGHDCDRLLSRWQLFRRAGDAATPLSHARYADEVACRSSNLPPARPASKKGLGGWGPNRSPELANELDELGISAVTVNIFNLHQFASPVPVPGGTPFTWQGRTYYAQEKNLAKFDRTFTEAAKRGAMVSAILLITNPSESKDPAVKLLGHPDAVKEGHYAMPNVTSAEGLAYYGAILNLIAERWSRPDGIHGRVHHWIMHNEVDFGWVWTNAGRKADISYLDLYQRSMRLADLIARQYDPNSRAFITLTHHWGQTGTKDGFGSKRLLDLLVRFGQAEGDFPWGLAYHPYPQNLFNPRTWEDQQATFDFNTAKITPKNLEVLDAYMKQPALRYRGQVRPVHLSENGFNSKEYTPKVLEDQAAGMALAWKKMQKLSSIESWQYHNWIDNRQEGGLRIGLRKFPDEPGDPLGKKPIWFLYQALGTPKENEIAAPYLKTIGIKSWDDLIHTAPIR